MFCLYPTLVYVTRLFCPPNEFAKIQLFVENTKKGLQHCIADLYIANVKYLPKAIYTIVFNYFIRSEYSPVRVSTFMRSPCSMNNGIRTLAPVSTIASFIAFVAVLPFTPGSV